MPNVIIDECFVPYDKIIVGNNEVSCRHLININGFYPIVVSKGVVPRLWLYVVSDGNRVALVDDSKEAFDKIKVFVDRANKTISIVLRDGSNPDFVILSADFMKEGVFNIKEMNLTPIGLSVFSNEKELVVGNNRISGNVVRGVDSFIALSDK